MNEALLLIGGDSVPAADNRFFQRINPVSGKPATKAVASSLRDVQSAVNAAAQVFPAWAATGPGKRRELLLRAADVMVASQGDFVATILRTVQPPVILGVRVIAMPLACGNTVVFKSSESCPAVHRLIGTVLHEAGLPAGVSPTREHPSRAIIIRGAISTILTRICSNIRTGRSFTAGRTTSSCRR